MSDHLRVATQPRWVGFTVLVGLLILVFVLLGRWQLSRADEQARSDAVRVASRAAAPVDVAVLMGTPGVPPDPGSEWRSVSAVGTYDADNQLLVRNRSLDAVNGYLVLVPLRTSSGTDLVVVRGWIPSGETAGAPAALPSVPPGVVTINGRLRVAEASTGVSDLPAGQVERIVPDEVADLTGHPTYSGWVVLGSERPTTVGTPAEVRTLPDGSLPAGRWPISHTVYAIQWFIFAAIGVIGWFVLLRRDVHHEREPAHPAPSASGV